MVKIIDYKKRIAKNEEFFVLEVSGGIEMVMSKTTGLYYATSKKASFPCTFSEEVCKSLIGSELEGKIVKTICEPYSFVIEQTGEQVTLNNRYLFIPEKVGVTKEEPVLSR